ncbi:MAG: hypothetical protein LUQ56_03790 [Methylococcaceae bacterium]|nr:hypothetical protein [Methylococcaceae bacterium]MDD1643002.1 hypothetical protein [Methylococcaceae bacterium]
MSKWCTCLSGQRTNERFACQDFHDDHRCTAFRADEGRLNLFYRHIGINQRAKVTTFSISFYQLYSK